MRREIIGMNQVINLVGDVDFIQYKFSDVSYDVVELITNVFNRIDSFDFDENDIFGFIEGFLSTDSIKPYGDTSVEVTVLSRNAGECSFDKFVEDFIWYLS